MDTLNVRQSVEVFHLIILDQLGRKLDKQKWALKGGCNLRFFFRSPRYSDDMDIDVQGLPVSAFRDRINAILSGNPLRTILAVRGISVEHVTEHKQSETTQRWKFGLTVAGMGSPVPTKIEFSRRGLDAGSVFEPLSPELIQFYELAPLMANHYPAAVAWDQKIGAILSRSATQARDIFDLHLLLHAGVRPSNGPAAGAPPQVDRIRENILGVDFDQFRGQVIAFLEPDIQPQYDSEELWDRMRWQVIEALGETPS